MATKPNYEQMTLNSEVLVEAKNGWKEYHKVLPEGHVQIRLKKQP